MRQVFFFFFFPPLDPRIEIPADAEFTLTERRSHFWGPLKQQTHQFHLVNDFISQEPPGSLTDSSDSSCCRQKKSRRSLVRPSAVEMNQKVPSIVAGEPEAEKYSRY